GDCRLNHDREFEMRSDTGYAKADPGIGAHADRHTRIKDRLEVLLVVGNSSSIFGRAWGGKRAFAVGRILKLCANVRMQGSLHKWLPHPGGLVREDIVGVVEHYGGDVPHRARLHLIDELCVDGFVAHTMCDDIDASLHNGLGVVEVVNVRGHTQAVFVGLVDDGRIDLRFELGRYAL